MTTHVRVGLFSPSIVLALAESTGGLARRGIEVETVPATSSPAQFRDLVSGRLDVAITNPDNVMLYRFIEANPLGGRHDVRILLGIDRGLGLSIHLAPGLTGLDQLRGGRLGVDVDVSGFAFAAYDLLARHGLVRGEDYTVVELGSTPRRLQALQAGECEATMLGAGNDLLADDAGLTRALRLVDEIEPYLATVLAASGPRLDRGDDAPGAVVDALREALALLGSGQARELAEELAARSLRLPQALASRYVDTLLDPREGLVVDGVPDLVSLDTVVAIRRRHRPDHGALDRVGAPDAGLIDARFLGADARRA